MNPPPTSATHGQPDELEIAFGRKAHPLGPWIERAPFRAGWKCRAAAICVAAGAGAVLGLAAWLKPDPSGVGTHRQLGYGPCGMLVMTGLPCPTCGMTTAFAESVRGRLWAGFRAQPMGMLLCVLTTLAGVGAIGVAVTGRMWRINRYRISPMKVIWAGCGLFLGAWAYKIAVTLVDAGTSVR